ncbi:uncharacterized protein LY79DRAFT_639844 [Colletotrichum navitas]|uniref:Uncharacterized protein n=1 Tax=Colletotrichum navitas TaxID=681940 RepID=A0AAD8PQA2_9PEZI|nr:uncharacterized protein LY79DRAFT_639844 [Colletotrichum navitas]KAK1574419.1 hypothetical protein LY79DRAFT_639844 [Colletotrichum navitas]
MHVRYILLAITSYFSIAFGLCYTNGRQGSYSRNQSILDLGDVCRQLSGKYNRLEAQRVCVTDKIDVSWSFELKMIGAGETREIDIEECMDGMKKELMCKPDRGGVHTYWNWRYKVKPGSRNLCFEPPYWKPIGGYDPQDEPKWYTCHEKYAMPWYCWKDKYGLPGYVGA